MAIASAGNLAFSALSLAVIVRATDLGASPTGVGVLLGLFGVGAIAGALVAPPVQRLVAPNVVMIGALWCWVAQMAALALAPTVFTLGAVYTVGALMGPIFNTTTAYRYALTPDRLQGRVNGASRMIGWGARPVGALLGGIALETLGAVPTFATLAAWLAVVAAASTTSRQIRCAPRLETLGEHPGT
ncbi:MULTISPECIES: hypothetical protein [unclassified Solwaraspora]|uniref:hypothetical protein n=1 Tax=unclassified Solwaraspora TaxID=2627926 RepID=UPI00338FE569